ncbi:hypothetical protein [uncultured Flavobacterium sp.]|uniref:hypothetical protein n=1 Tax=uncultured Flavobacterium sp. TaxID=165435 RepID=UPI002598FFC0|nr:hypothetical protein [uncultured Flavobacterium sp.]
MKAYKITKTYSDKIDVSYEEDFDVSVCNINQVDYDIKCEVLKDDEYREFFAYNSVTQEVFETAID